MDIGYQAQLDIRCSTVLRKVLNSIKTQKRNSVIDIKNLEKYILVENTLLVITFSYSILEILSADFLPRYSKEKRVFRWRC